MSIKQQDVSFFWDGDDLIISIHNAKPNAAGFISALLAAGATQEDDGTAEYVPAEPYAAPKKNVPSHKNAFKEQKEDMVAYVKSVLKSTEPDQYLKKAKDPDREFRILSAYCMSKEEFKHKEITDALNSYISNRFANISNVDEYVGKLSDQQVIRFISCFYYCYRKAEQKQMARLSISQKREMIKSLILRLKKTKA